ncbi:hypothetical protein HW532_21485 [Kaustia mangrovi]|uniref:Uncharacterized protein n=1 Tax=Kaustia mangrovi TaxID=2593653 RepID=A0A7S8C7W3_9HYPH|nr:hypothetical protein [Kaustia mangrovi]QPC45040.1 hypothetical protein HW532_21485 [Kaustia mangrovi]
MYLIPGKTARESLSLAFDGPIPYRLHRWAQAHDREHPLPHGQARIRLGRVRLSRRVLIDLMAGIIAEAAGQRGVVTLDDFARAGISEAVAREHSEEAFAKALAANPHIADLLEPAR